MTPFSNSKRKIFYLAAVIALPLFIYSCGGGSDDNSGAVSGGTPVKITHPAVLNMSDYLTLNGNTVFLKKEIVRATFAGFIVKINKNIGDKVSAGDILFKIKTKESAADDSIKLKLGSRLFIGEVEIKASSNGVLTQLDYHEGDFVTDGEQLAVVSNPSSLRIKLNVPYEDNLKVNIGGSCEVNLPDGENLPGIIENKVPAVDPATQTQIYYVKILNGKELPENLNTMVKIPFKTYKDAVALPKSSIMTNVTQDQFWIMKLINDTTALRVDISKGIENDSMVQIINPKLQKNERIISDGAYGLPDTAKVEIEK